MKSAETSDGARSPSKGVEFSCESPPGRETARLSTDAVELVAKLVCGTLEHHESSVDFFWDCQTPPCQLQRNGDHQTN